jgi:hypothetical protein
MALTWLRFALAAVGIVVWGWGYRADDSIARWIGIVLLAAALFLRLVRRRQPEV